MGSSSEWAILKNQYWVFEVKVGSFIVVVVVLIVQ